MKTITILNEKGGVGKTTIAVTVAAGLAARGQRVLLIDADAQGNATAGVGVRKYPGLYDLLVRWDDLLDAHNGDRGKVYGHCTRVIPREWYGGLPEQGVLALIGSNVETRNIANSISDADKLARLLEPLASRFDVCLIDTAPTPSLLHGSIYMASDFILYPTLCEVWSLEGLSESVSRLDAVQRQRRVRVGGIIPTRYRGTTIEHRENLAELKREFVDLVWPELPERIVWPEAAGYRRPVFLHAPDSDAADHAWELVDRVEALGVGVQNGE